MRIYLSLIVLLHLALGSTTPQDPEAGIIGIWRGQLTAGSDRSEIAFAVERAPSGVSLFLTLPPLRAWRMPVGTVSKTGESDWAIPDWGITLRVRNGVLTGSVGDPRVAFSLKRADALPKEPAKLPAAGWPAAPPLAWSFDAGAPLWGSPATMGDAVYIADEKGRVHAVDAKTGARRWVVDLGAAVYGDVTVSGDGVFVFDESGTLSRLNTSDGRLRWRAALGAGDRPRVLPTAAAADFDYKSPAPLVDNGAVYLASAQGVVFAIDAETGRVEWQQPLGMRVRAGVVASKSQLLVGGFGGYLAALDRVAGKQLWRHDTFGPVTSAVALASDVAVVGSRSSWLTAVRLSDGTPVWSKFNWFSWVESTGVVVGDALYIGSSDLRSVRALGIRGGETRWDTDVLGFVWGTPLVTADVVYAGVAGAREYITPHAGGLVALDRATGRVKWGRAATLKPGAYLSGYTGSPAMSGRRLFAANINGILEAYDIR